MNELGRLVMVPTVEKSYGRIFGKEVAGVSQIRWCSGGSSGGISRVMLLSRSVKEKLVTVGCGWMYVRLDNHCHCC